MAHLLGFSRRTEGLGKETPMSSLPFALGMDYLDRIFSYVGELEGFKFHARCKELKLLHLCLLTTYYFSVMENSNPSTPCYMIPNVL